ncbi:MAG: carbamoyltransferase HypF [Desulfuromonadaceae bacterium]|nr:carbamoyltransferase HypF [Desulfuromonadaceae bacterium]
MVEHRDAALIYRRKYAIQGIVQGVGFRPFVYRLALEQDVTGWVRNTPAGVEIECQGSSARLDAFEAALLTDLPPLAVITAYARTDIPVNDDHSFTILPSGTGMADIQIAPDTALCSDCLRELFDPNNRRYRYPFTTCTNCGPRYSIITGIPYDRPKTTMAAFPLCPDCQHEYRNPLDRRFHAQPIACHACGPQVRLIACSGEHIANRDEAIRQAVEQLKNGAILAVKGISGYHLAVDASNQDAVRRLRERKKRDEKPFAVMVPSVEAARTLTLMSKMEERLLCSPEAPIIIVRKRPDTGLAPLVAPNNGWLGLMLPYAPLHHLLIRGNFPALVMTSGNISDEPVAFEDHEALQRLAGIADFFLLHNRPIHIRSDDSVMRVFQERPLFYRRARGYAPRAVTLPFTVPPLLAAGAELKSAVCLADGNRAVLSQHIGDLQNQSTFDSFSHTITHLSSILAIKPELVACDLHPDYLSSRFAENSGLPLVHVQHHHAHLASCMAENGLDDDVIGIIFDGTGYGTDSTVWGGEFLVGGYHSYRRAGHFRPVHLPGGDMAVREPWRMAIAYLYQALGEAAFTIDHPVTRILPEQDRALFAQMLRRGINSPLASSCGRLFDAVAALLNLRHSVSYDGQGAIELEAVAETAEKDMARSYCYDVVFHQEAPVQLDFSPMVIGILADIDDGIKIPAIAYRFHNTVVSAATEMCLHISASTGLDRVILSGGVFQNRLLSEMVYTSLNQKGLKVFTHRLVPPNDGGIALGQIAIAGRRIS